MNFYETLAKNVANSKMEIVSFGKNALVLELTVSAPKPQIFSIAFDNPVYLDMPPEFMVQKLEFDGIKLLPEDYLTTRLKGYEGDDDLYRVLRITDDENNQYFVIAYGKEEIHVT